MGSPKLEVSCSEVRVVWGPLFLQLSEVRVVLWKTMSLTCEVWLKSG